jgi:hypothetical protein
MIPLSEIKRGSTSTIVTVDILDSSSTIGARLAGLNNASCGTLSYKRDTAAGSVVVTTINAITTLGAFAGTATQAAFKAVDATNMPGLYEIHLPNDAFAAGASEVVFCLKGATNAVPLYIKYSLVANVEADSVADLSTLLGRLSAARALKLDRDIAEKADVSPTVHIDEAALASGVAALIPAPDVTISPTPVTVNPTTLDPTERGLIGLAAMSVLLSEFAAFDPDSRAPANIGELLIDIDHEMDVVHDLMAVLPTTLRQNLLYLTLEAMNAEVEAEGNLTPSLYEALRDAAARTMQLRNATLDDGADVTPDTLGTDGVAVGAVMPLGEITVYRAGVAEFQFDADAAGAFSFRLPTGGTWTLRARRVGYRDALAEVTT